MEPTGPLKPKQKFRPTEPWGATALKIEARTIDAPGPDAAAKAIAAAAADLGMPVSSAQRHLLALARIRPLAARAGIALDGIQVDLSIVRDIERLIGQIEASYPDIVERILAPMLRGQITCRDIGRMLDRVGTRGLPPTPEMMKRTTPRIPLWAKRDTARRGASRIA